MVLDVSPPYILRIGPGEQITFAEAERSEAITLSDFQAAAPDDVRAALAMDAMWLGGGAVLSMRDDPTGFWSKTLGIGLAGPVTADMIDEVIAFYRSCGTPRATFQIAPAALPPDWDEICARFSIERGGTWVKLACRVDEAIRRADQRRLAPEGLRIAAVESDDAREWALTVLRGFGMPEEHFAEMAAGSVGRDAWRPYAAWVGDRIVAAGTLHLDGAFGHLFAGATLPEARRRGAQSALLAARARAAQDAGCRWLLAETGAEAPGGHNSSLHNMLRLGFLVLYERPNWVWRAESQG